VEALVRWQHPERGFLLPNTFISLAEDTGLIVPIGEWVLREASQQLVKWHQAGQSDLRLSVNLSEREIKHPDLIGNIERVLNETGLDPKYLEFELTENVVFQAIEEHLPLLHNLQSMGVRLSIDDFGTGNSTLRQITRLPFNTLKIDYIFASEVLQDPKTIAIISGIVDIAANLGMDVIAEGIENLEQLEAFQAEGCELVQGFYYSPAVPPDKITQLLKGNK
ncbi:MAG TPA: EAL domain-containing protein, partial [Anaerolineales bacterium]|nr:EAL domain-containing protein [Anaerolineales bacterium]